MRYLPLGFAILLLAGWCWGGSAWFSRQYCGQMTKPTQTRYLYIEDGLEEIAKAPMPVFPFQSAHPEMPAATAVAFHRLAHYLRDHPGRSISVTGYAHPDESDTGLSLKRAESIANLLTSMGAPKQAVIRNGVPRRDITFRQGRTDQAFALVFFTKQDIPPDFMPLRLYFGEGKYRIHANKSLEEYAARLASFLKEHPGRMVHITGFENSSETSGQGMIWYKRAISLRNYLMQSGISGHQMQLQARSDPSPPLRSSPKNRRAELRILRP